MSIFCPIPPKQDMNIGKLLFTLSSIKHEQIVKILKGRSQEET